MYYIRKFWILLGISILLCSRYVHAACIPFDQAIKHVGEAHCVAGKVFRVQQGAKGTHYLDFCEDYRTCTFTVVIFLSDLKHVGDVRQLQDHQIEVHGDVKLYDGRAEIILTDASQLGGDGARIPRLPKDYDVEQRGHYSAGTLSRPSSSSTTTAKRQPATIPAILPSDNDTE